MTGSLTADEYRELLTTALPVATDADTIEPNLQTLFTPDGHRHALEPDVTIVRGARGAGKTVWFKSLQDAALRHVAAEAYQLPRLHRLNTVVGFGSELAPDRYPGRRILASLLEDGASPVEVWLTVLLTAVDADLAGQAGDWFAKVRWVRSNPEASELALSRVDRSMTESGQTTLVLFDALEHLHEERTTTDRLVGGVLRLALDLRTRTRNLRAKVFIRPDMVDSASLHFPDSSKLLANAANLAWTEPNLYGLLLHHLGNARTALADRFRESQGRWRREEGLDEAAAPRYRPPAELTGDRATQQQWFVQIAGQYMGTDHRKGHTYTWLPNHLMDGLGQVSPRSFLTALVRAVAVTKTQYAGHRYALHYEGIRRGVQEASRIRVQEVVEDIPWVVPTITALEGIQVPADRDLVLDRWRANRLTEQLRRQTSRFDLDREPDRVRTGPRDPDDYPRLIDELCQIGVMTVRANQRIDLPDVYRIAFNIGRKGGVPRLKAS